MPGFCYLSLQEKKYFVEQGLGDFQEKEHKKIKFDFQGASLQFYKGYKSL